jgi:hypothetical protein
MVRGKEALRSRTFESSISHGVAGRAPGTEDIIDRPNVRSRDRWVASAITTDIVGISRYAMTQMWRWETVRRS